MDRHLARIASSPAVLTLIGINIAALVLIMLVFGVALEQRVGARHVVLIYLAAGLVGSLAVVLTSQALGLDERMVGSSAAFHGIIAAFIALRPDAVVLRSKAKTWLIVLVVANLVLMFPTDFTPLSGAGHLAGLAVGFLYGHQLRTAAGPRPTKTTSVPWPVANRFPRCDVSRAISSARCAVRVTAVPCGLATTWST